MSTLNDAIRVLQDAENNKAEMLLRIGHLQDQVHSLENALRKEVQEQISCAVFDKLFEAGAKLQAENIRLKTEAVEGAGCSIQHDRVASTREAYEQAQANYEQARDTYEKTARGPATQSYAHAAMFASRYKAEEAFHIHLTAMKADVARLEDAYRKAGKALAFANDYYSFVASKNK